jgi:hypothetical protein
VEFNESRLLRVYSSQTATDFQVLEDAPTRQMSRTDEQNFVRQITDVNSTVRAGINTVFAGQVTAAQAAQAAAEAARDETIIATTAQSDWTGAVSIANGHASIAKSNWMKRQLTGNTTLTMGTGTASKAYTVTIEVVQDATGGRTLAWSGVSWAYGVAPTMSTAAAARDIYYLTWTGNIWVGSVGAQAVA